MRRRWWNASSIWRRSRPQTPAVYRSQYADMTGAYTAAWVTNAGPSRRSRET